MRQSYEAFTAGRYGEALRLAQQGLEVARQLDPKQWPRVLPYSLDTLATLYQQLGRYAEAEPLYRQALELRRRPGIPRAELTKSLQHMGGFYEAVGNYEAAEQHYREAYQLDEADHALDYVLARDLRSIAEILYLQDRNEETEAMLKRALDLDENAYNKSPPGLVRDLLDLANLYTDERKYDQAEPLLVRALEVERKQVEDTQPGLGDHHPGVAVVLGDLGRLYYERGDFSRAREYHRKALAIWKAAVGPSHPEVAWQFESLATVEYAAGRPAQAARDFDAALAILAAQFRQHFLYMTEKERLLFLSSVDATFEKYFSFCLSYRRRSPALLARMYDVAVWRKGFIGTSMAMLRARVSSSGDLEAQRLLEQLTETKTQLAALLNSPSEDRAAWNQRVVRLQRNADVLERQLVGRLAHFPQPKALEFETWRQVQRVLRPGEAAVEWVTFEFHDGRHWTKQSRYVALVITPATRSHPRLVLLGEGGQREGAPWLEFQQQVQARGMEAAVQEKTPVLQPGARTYDLFWKPLEPWLAGKTRLFLAPDGLLNQAPLGLIPMPDGTLLMEKYDLRLLSSTKDLLRPAAPSRSRAAVLLGDPAFDLSETGQRAALAGLASPQETAPVLAAGLGLGERSRDQGAGVTLPPLPGTGAEVRAVGGLLQKHQWRVTSYTGARALEEAVKEVRSPRLLHLATHGFFLPDQELKNGKPESDQLSGLEDPMLRSGLFFAGADRALAHQPLPADLDDGVLTAYEATGLDLQGTELVVLSACNTGQGEMKNGEGVFGLRRALQEAGAQAVLMSMWSVPDRETQELMTLFYGKWLSGTEKHEALRQAQLEMRERVKQRYGRDLPYYWGAFVLVGR